MRALHAQGPTVEDKPSDKSGPSIHTYIHTYIHTHMHTYIHTASSSRCVCVCVSVCVCLCVRFACVFVRACVCARARTCAGMCKIHTNMYILMYILICANVNTGEGRLCVCVKKHTKLYVKYIPNYM
jgi:hypothetical protein